MTARQRAMEELKTVDSSWPDTTSQARRRFSQGWKGGGLVMVMVVVVGVWVSTPQFLP